MENNKISIIPKPAKNTGEIETSVRAQIKKLEPGDAVGFPIERIDYILSCRTRLQQITGNKYNSRIDGETVFITREEENTPEKPGNL